MPAFVVAGFLVEAVVENVATVEVDAIDGLAAVEGDLMIIDSVDRGTASLVDGRLVDIALLFDKTEFGMSRGDSS